MSERPSESEPTEPTIPWIDIEMRADSPIWDTIERLGTDGKYSEFTSLALQVDPVQFNVEPNYLTGERYYEFVRYEVAGDTGDEPLRKSVNECNRAWQEMMIHSRVGFSPTREGSYSRSILDRLTEPLNRESVVFGLALTFQVRHRSERDTGPMFDNVCAEFGLSPVEQRGIARLAAKARPDETLKTVLLNKGGKLAEQLTDADGRPDLGRFGGPDALERCKADTLERLVKHGDGDPAELEAALRGFYPELMDPESDSAELREKLADTWWEKLMLLSTGMMNRGDDLIELAPPLADRIDREAVLERVRTDIEGVIADPPPEPLRGQLDRAILGPWRPAKKAAAALERFKGLFPEAVA